MTGQPADFAAAPRRRSTRPCARPSRLRAHHVLDALREQLPADGILAYDVGAHTHQIATPVAHRPARHLPRHQRLVLDGLRHAGRLRREARPSRATVVGVVGDGCFQMTAGELAMARRLSLAVADRRPQRRLARPDQGEAGTQGLRLQRRRARRAGADAGALLRRALPRGVHSVEELNAALDWALSLDGPSVIEAFVDVEPYSTTVYD